MIWIRRAIILTTACAAVSLGGVGVLASDVVDEERPSAPFIETARQERPGVVQLVWTSARDNVGVVEYRILANGKPLLTLDATAELFEPFWFLEDVPPGNMWIQIQAVDAAGNESVRSAPAYLRINNNPIQPPTGIELDYEARTGCVDVSFEPSPDDRTITDYYVRENLRVVKSVEAADLPDGRISTRYCQWGQGYQAFVQVEAVGLRGERSVRTAPVSIFKHYSDAPRGFDAVVDGGTVQLSWDAPSERVQAASFQVLDAFRPIADLPVDARDVTLELEPGRHWLQLVTVNVDGGQSRRTAPVFVDVAE